jgi:hypothetical protein
MEISVELLKKALGEAFDLGYSNSNEFKNDLIDELLSQLRKTPSEEYRVYKCAELKKMPEGTIFNHVTRGRCWIVNRSDGTKAMKFQKGDVIGLLNDNEPWDRPMKLLHSETTT